MLDLILIEIEEINNSIYLLIYFNYFCLFLNDLVEFLEKLYFNIPKTGKWDLSVLIYELTWKIITLYIYIKI